MKNMLIQYYRDRRGNPCGCVVAIKAPVGTDGKFRLGWSLCCKRDVFKKKLAVDIAVGRAFRDDFGEIPSSLYDTWNIMYNRASMYFR